MVRGGRQSTVRGALYESTSIAAVYGTICSLVWGTMGAALNLGTRVPGNLGGKQNLLRARNVNRVVNRVNCNARMISQE